jgi:hypothetical protein
MIRIACVLLMLTAGAKLPAQVAVRPPFLDAVLPPADDLEMENPFEDRIETDRDAFTPTPRTIGPGRFAIESAYSFIDNRAVKETHSFPELLLRYGISESIELRLGWNYEVGGEGNSVSGAGRFAERRRPPREDAEREPEEPMEEAMRLVRESQVTYGTKILLNGQNGWLPESSAILMGATPTSGDATNTDIIATYVWGWELPNEWKLDMAIRYATEKEESDHFNIWSPSAVLRIPLSERCTVHGEYFSFFTRGREQDVQKHFVSGGASYLITPDLEVGVRGGPGLNDQSARWFVNAGFGWRF